MENEETTLKKRNKSQNEQPEAKAEVTKDNDLKKETATKLRYGPMPHFANQRLWSRSIFVAGLMVYIWWYNVTTGPEKEISLARQTETFELRSQKAECDRDYLDEIRNFPGCVPKKCGRYIADKLVTLAESDTLLAMAKRGLALGGSNGGASILDLHSGALSYGEKFINIYQLANKQQVITEVDLAVYKTVKSKIRHAIAEKFKLEEAKLYLTHPTFFSRLTNASPKTEHDEYWHLHVDKNTYESFHYTSLLYLSDYGLDFQGGRFAFSDLKANVTIEPKKGRVSFFTSGGENPHFVEPVTEGTRFAVTISFTCDKAASVKDPTIK